MAEKGRNQTVISNRKASFEYHLQEKFEAGIILTGTEVKSLRGGKASLQESYCTIEGDEVFILNMNIAQYEKGGYANHNPTRSRKLLLKRKEINKLKKGLDQEGATIVPLKIFFNDRNLAKMEIALAKGKKIHDKRETLKEKETKREMDRQMQKYV